MWWHATRDWLAPFLRWKHWGALFLTIGIFAAIAELLKDTASNGDSASTISKLALSLGAILKARDAMQSFKLWRWLRPRYRGLDDFMKRLDSSQLFSQAFMTVAEGEVMIEASAFLTQVSTLLSRIEFVGRDPVLNAFAARINSDAFRGTLYHATMEEKRRRNAPLAALQKPAFALIRSQNPGYSHDGLAVVLPMNRQGLAAYLSGKLSDNDIAPRHLARPNQRPEAMLVFLIANAWTGKSRMRTLYPDMLDALIQACIVQIITIAIACRTTTALPRQRTLRRASTPIIKPASLLILAGRAMP